MFPLTRTPNQLPNRRWSVSHLVLTSCAIGALIGTTSCRRQPQEPPPLPTVQGPDQPNIRFDADSYDFGTLFQMRSSEHVFKLQNAGREKLVVTNVTSSCGCTATLLSAKEIPPGGTTDLKVELKTGMLEGEVAKEIIVASNDPDEPIKKLKIKGNVARRLLIEPRMLRFGLVRKIEGATAWLDVKPAPDVAIKSLEAKSTTRDLVASLEPVAGSSQAYRVKVAIGKDVPLTHISGWIEFYLNGETAMCSQVLVSASVIGNIDLSPKHLIFRAPYGKAQELGAINLTRSVPGVFQILGTESSMPEIQVEVSPIEQGRSYSVIARLAPDVAKGQVRGTITVRTDDPIQPKIPINVLGIVE